MAAKVKEFLDANRHVFGEIETIDVSEFSVTCFSCSTKFKNPSLGNLKRHCKKRTTLIASILCPLMD